MTRKAVFALATIIVLLSLQITNTFACSGFAHFGIDDLSRAELLVRATVIDADDRGYNAVLRVEEYFKGEGPRLVTVMRYRPALASGALVRGYDTGCVYAGRGHRFYPGTQGYFGLESNSDGTYTDDIWGTAHFYPVEGMITYQEGATEGYYVELDESLVISESDFREKLLETGGYDAPLEPADGNPGFFPLMRFLTLTTESGTRYQINPDRSLSELPADAPLAISPDGAHVAFRFDENTILMQSISTIYQPPEEHYPEDVIAGYERRKMRGQQVAFSNDSSFIAVWDQQQLGIYMVRNDGADMYTYQAALNIYPVAQVEVVTDDAEVLPQVLWSADSSTLAWEDDSGIWHWDIFNEAVANHLVSRKDIGAAVLMDVSTHGRYVRFGDANEWWLIDTLTEEYLPNTLVSPDERFLIRTQGGMSPAFPPVERYCAPPLRNSCTKFQETSGVESTFAYGSNLLAFINCAEDDTSCEFNAQSWHPAIWSDQGYGRSASATITNARQIIYDPRFDQSAVLVGDHDIYFSFYRDYLVENHRPRLDIVNLENLVDSRIESIEWGQPVFYDEYAMMTPVYLP